jgi:hypothetical protein
MKGKIDVAFVKYRLVIAIFAARGSRFVTPLHSYQNHNISASRGQNRIAFHDEGA